MAVLQEQQILKKAQDLKMQIAKFLSDMVKIPSLSGGEAKLVNRIKEEMEKLGYDKVEIDEFGNIIGTIGHGNIKIAIDGHIDTVDVGNADLWSFEPFSGDVDNEKVYGRGTADQEGGFASAVYAGKLIKELGLEDKLTLYVVGSVMEEDCDGLPWIYLIEKKALKPDFVILTEPTGLRIYRGHRGRMEIKITTEGISAHGSAPERGDNAIYKMAPIISDIEKLNNRLKVDKFLGKGTITISGIFSESPSQCSVADKCWISLDRRLTLGETPQSAVKELQDLESVKKVNAKVEIYKYKKPTHTGYVLEVEKFYPTWVVNEDSNLLKVAKDSYKQLFKEEPVIDKWTFSTNGVAIMGRYNIPCIGFGPGYEEQAHAPDEFTYIDHLYKATAFYTAYIHNYVKEAK